MIKNFETSILPNNGRIIHKCLCKYEYFDSSDNKGRKIVRKTSGKWEIKNTAVTASFRLIYCQFKMIYSQCKGHNVISSYRNAGGTKQSTVASISLK